ncbi:NAD(P)/FAD-dependent oxidoreductase [Mycobacteroides abscessus]|uniref:NAD(P)/FAD-dependent oxidoreductase n=1 Tax=Mycobacteroides abscessus TaxID=36809 RepID=UPI000C266A02|nr:FAD/NAD(P)-binding oxidoreductase [Mycobacteroides abscessus]
MRKKLVVLGAGIGGLTVIDELKKLRSTVDVDITLVDENFSHFLGFTLPWVMRGWRGVDSVPIRPTAEALITVSTVEGTVVKIDPQARLVYLADDSTLDYDALVVALGSKNDTSMVSGLTDAVEIGAAVHYYSANGAADAHRALVNFRGGRLVFLVTALPYRCPVAPYEGALLAADLLEEQGVRAAAEIAVYSPEQQPMPSAGPYAGPQLLGILADKNIAFHAQHSATHVDCAARTISFANGETVNFDLLVFIPPHRPAITLGGSGWINIDRHTMKTDYEGVWAVGDITAVTSPSDKPLPKAAIFAKNGGRAAAQNVLTYLGLATETSELSGLGYCYLDTGMHQSAQGKGDFFALPHPAVRLTGPSDVLHRDKIQEEADWRTLWE